MTIVSHDLELVFLKTRKTAGTSIELLLSNFCGPDDVLAPLDPADEEVRTITGPGARNCGIPLRRYSARDLGRLALHRRRAHFYNHMPAAEVRQSIGQAVWDRYLKVSVERDRYERAVSMYKWAGRDSETPADLLKRLPTYKISNTQIYCIDGRVSADVIIEFADLANGVGTVFQHLGISGAADLPTSKSRGGTTRAEAMEILGEEGRRIVDAAHGGPRPLDLSPFTPGRVLGGHRT